ncbi:efflux RND transporter periplasmic adaptor subunit [candidate division KSB1 bacterium]
MKRIFLIIISLMFLALACSSPDTRVESSIEVPVEVEEVAAKSIEEYVVATGTVYSAQEAVMKSESQGYYRIAVNPDTKKPFALGNRVKKEQVIVYLDNPEQETNIKIESHKLNLENTQREFEKQQSLHEKGGVTLRDVKNAEKSYVDAKYAYDNAIIQLSKLKIQAPFDGIIVNMPYYTKGIKVPANSEIVNIMNFSTLVMEINLPGKILGVIKSEQPVRISNYQYPDKELSGKINQVSPTLDAVTRTFKAAVNIDNSDLLLRPGMFVTVDIVTEKKDNVIVISKDVILTRRNRKTVFVVSQGYARERRIQTGLENPNEIEVTEGLANNDRLVISGYETLVNGSKVRISQEGQR